MPTYEYVCKSCGEHLEVVQSFTDESLTTCLVCGGQLRKVFGSIGIAFKGSGFYRTDSRPAAAKKDKDQEKAKEKSAASAKDGSSGKDGAGSKEAASSTSAAESSSSKPESSSTPDSSKSTAGGGDAKSGGRDTAPAAASTG